jgi:tRNA modification GTPase
VNPQNKIEGLYLYQYPNDHWVSTDTIAAIATPPGKGAIGIIRISGNSSLAVSKKIFRHNNSLAGKVSSSFQSHHLYYGKIIDPENKEVIDEVILLPMIAPRSYTREDIIEIQSHSGNAVLEKILSIILKQGIRIAEPGEFTKRAFLNGRIDLTQAEAVMDIINAENDYARKIATRQLSGALKDKLIHIKSKIMESLSEIEAEIEFAEDQGEGFIRASSWQTDILSPLIELKESADLGQIFKEGIRVVLVGKPNVGKSSLMNRLLNQERAIVTPFPGTTRDHIEERIEINGIMVNLIDTAGIHRSRNPIEILGIKKSKEIIHKANLILFVCDGSSRISNEDQDIFKIIQEKRKIIVYNKLDLVDEKYIQHFPADWQNEPNIHISALKNDGVEELKILILNKVIKGKSFEQEGLLISSIRQKKNIEKASKAIQNAIRCHENNAPLEIIAIEFKEAVKQINHALGIEITDDVFDQIFNNFCIGK